MSINTGFISSRNKKARISCDINITPLVDVMLVLLVIFMVTSPMLVAGVNVDLPETQATPATGHDEPLVLTVNKKGEIFIADTAIDITDLSDKLGNITQQKKDTRIFVRGDKNVPYGKMVEVIAQVHYAGFNKVALVSNIKQNEK